MLQVNTLPKTNEQIQRIAPNLGSVSVERMEAGQEREVIDYLEQRPIHTVAMVSLIRDNGLVSQLNRGTFYSCRDMNGHLEGVALVGHATLMETVSDRALQALAQVAQECPDTHMIMGEQDRIEEFWTYCSKLRWPIPVHGAVASLHLATLKELHMVMPIQARMAFEESGVNPLEVDPEGFRKRCIRRIELGRTWVLVENDQLVFKADVISETPEVIYLEGVWLSENKRGSDFGVSCISGLSRKLLSRSRSICLLVNENNKQAQAFYRKCGFLFRATYETIFLPQKDQAPTSVN